MFPHFDAMGGWVGWGREPRRERTHGGNAVMEDGKEMSRRHALRLKLDAGVMSSWRKYGSCGCDLGCWSTRGEGGEEERSVLPVLTP